MSDQDFDSFESNWNEFPEESGWNEHQWRKYLDESDSDIERFLAVYETFKDAPDHFEEIVDHMGWDSEDISLTDDLDTADLKDDTEESSDDDAATPYTPLNHPVIVITYALYGSLRKIWENYISKNGSYISPQTCWEYAESIHEAEINVIHAVQAIDLCDYGLTICHLKNSLSALNKTFAVLDQIFHPDEDFLENFRQEIRTRLFDLRELWLRVMNDCRTESNRRSDNDSD